MKEKERKFENRMKRFDTTLCYIFGPSGVLMLHRTKKENDLNKDKYIGVGGHLEHGESPEECVLREVKEETGVTMTSFRLRGILTFVIDEIDEISFLYTCDGFDGEPREGDACNEGELVWVDPDKVGELPIWPGDKIFFRLLKERDDVFSLKLTYINDVLTDAAVDGKKIEFVV